MQRTLIKDTASKAGEDVMLKGWVEVRRDHGKLVFLDIRDRSGIVQAVVIPQTSPAAYEVAQAIRPEFVVEIAGKVNKRPEKNINKDIPTGTVEIEVKSLNILSRSETPPFDLTTDGLEIGEEVRLRYRYLDLRRKRMQENLRLRSDYMQALRQALIKKDFVEIETPLLTKTTMEGARDFIVPSRFQPGKFYALPQSPQQYKQLLMVAGFERYFQFPHCLRDEDLRADRGFEHTQLDLEMSFVEQKDVMALDEEMVSTVVESMGYKVKEKPFPVFTYQEATHKFKADKFDLRNEAEKKNKILAKLQTR